MLLEHAAAVACPGLTSGLSGLNPSNGPSPCSAAPADGQPDDLRRVGVGPGPNLRAVVGDFGYVQVAILIDADLVRAVELARLRSMAADVEDVAAVQVVA